MVTENLSQYSLPKGDRFYMDAWHRNHLEVFRKRNSKFLQECVINFDGSINEAETAKVLKQMRKIRS